MSTSIRELLGVELPIIQAPMAGVQDSALTISVAQAGGLGSLACAMLSAEKLESELRTIKLATNAPINLNFFCHQPPKTNSKIEAQWRSLLKPYFSELKISAKSIPTTASRQPFSHDIADVIEPHTPKILSFHFGLPDAQLLQRTKKWGATILASATTVEEALWLEENGADMIIAQGLEAGGHRGMFLTRDLNTQSNATPLLCNILKRVDLPVIAAGGISQASEVAHVINKGAIAALAGTAYLLCDEAKTSSLHRQAIKTPNESNGQVDTTITNLFSGRPARGIINRVIRELGPINQLAPEFPRASTAITALRNAAEAQGLSDFSPLWCGQNTQGCEAISAFKLTRKLASLL